MAVIVDKTATAKPVYTVDMNGDYVGGGGGGGGGDASAANQTTQITAANLTNTRVGDLTETAPASDTASSGLNGRLQRIAQRLTSVLGSLGLVSDAAWTSGDGTHTALLKAIAAQAISTAPSVVSNSTLSATQLLATGSVSAVGTSALSITVAANSQVVEFYNLSDTVIWLSVTGTAVAATSASIPVPALASGVAGFWVAPPGFVGTISIIAASGSGKAFTCWRYA